MDRPADAEAGSDFDELEISDLNIVGRYALNFRWSDGHETGIYSFQYLRDIVSNEDDSIATNLNRHR